MKLGDFVDFRETSHESLELEASSHSSRPVANREDVLKSFATADTTVIMAREKAASC